MIQPTGTVTFLFTDIEGSTRLWDTHPDAMRAALEQHDAIVRAAMTAHGGHIFKAMGDAFCVAFESAVAALDGAITLQRQLAPLAELPEVPIRVRVGLHTGEASERDGDYFGAALSLVARLMNAGHGGQILLSQPTIEAIRDALPSEVRLIDLGEHRLKDLLRSQRLFQAHCDDLPRDFPPLRTLNSRPNNLPAQPNALIGRADSIAAIKALLRTPDTRLVTLTGTGGTGKTRLSLQVAADLLEQFEHGVTFVALAAISDATLVPIALAQALSVQVGEGDTLSAVTDYLRARQLLLLLDNFEQIMPASEGVSAILKAAPGVRIIVTSREALRIYGEHEYSVPPLALPDPDEPMPIARLSQFAAVDLFIQRSQAVRPDFQVTDDNAHAVAAICARLDGLPLAIELAASRIRMFAPDALLTRLETRLTTLTGGARDLPARQQTLRGAIAWSYDLLDQGEKALFAHLGLFSGGWSLDAAAAVCPLADADMLDALDGLAHKSLIRISDGHDGEPRFTMLETLREYALDRLKASGALETPREAHAHYYAAQAQRFAFLPHRRIEVSAVNADLDNYRAALRALHMLPDGAEREMWLIGGLHDYFYTTGRWREGSALAQAALQRDSETIDPAARALTYNLSAVIGAHLGDAQAALVGGEFAYDLIRGRGLYDVPAIRVVTGYSSLLIESDLVLAVALMEETVGWCEAIDADGLATSLKLNLCMAYSHSGEIERALALNEEMILSARRSGYDNMLAVGLEHRSRNALANGRWEQVLHDTEEGIACARRTGSSYIVFGLLTVRHKAQLALERFDDAAVTDDALYALATDFGSPIYQLEVEIGSIETAFGRGMIADVLARLLALKDHLPGHDDAYDYHQMIWLLTAANVLAVSAFADDAARLYGFFDLTSQSHRGELTLVVEGAAHRINKARLLTRLDDRFEVLFADGAALTHKQAVALVIDRITAAQVAFSES